MDEGPAPDPIHHPRVLDDVLRQVRHGAWLGGWSGSDLLGWEQTALHDPSLFLTTNNAAEYEALINGLCIAVELGAMRMYVHGESELVIDQVMKESSCKSPLMAASCPPKGQ